MKIIFSGLPYFSKKLIADLNEFDKKNSYFFFDTYYSKIDRIKFLFHLFNADKVVSFNGVSSKSGSLDWVIRLRKKLIIQWQGSDVSMVKENQTKNQFTRKYIDYAKSYTDAEWLKEELNQLGISVDLLAFKHVQPTTNIQPFQTSDVVSYVADGTEIFYGIEKINLLAIQFPKIKFHIIGSKGTNCQSPPNVIFYGWVTPEKVAEMMNTHPIFVRLTDHDGYSLSVMEAIGNGNYVLWNNPHPCTTFVDEEKNLHNIFSNLLTAVETNSRKRLMSSMDWVKVNLSREKILQNYVDVLTSE